MFFLSSIKLQYSRAIVNAKEAEAFRETSFSKATMVMRFPAKKNAGCLKAPRNFPPKKDGILYPRRVVLGLPSPSHRVCGDGRTYGHVTITSEPKFLGLIVYQNSLAMELCWRLGPQAPLSNNLKLCQYTETKL